MMVAAATLSGCSTIEKDASYGTVESLGKAVSEVLNIECGKGSGNSATAGWDQDTCGNKATIGVFTNPKTQREVKAKNPSGATSTIVEGENWIVWVSGGQEQLVQDRLGGKIVSAPELFTGVINLEFTPASPSYLAIAEGPAQKACFPNRLSPYKDLGENSKATVTTSSGLVLEGTLVSSDMGDTTCSMRYEVDGVPAGDGPYDVSIGHRAAPKQDESELKTGAQLTIGN